MHNRSEIIPEPNRAYTAKHENDLESSQYSIESIAGGRSTAPIVTQTQQISDLSGLEQNQYFMPSDISSKQHFQHRRNNPAYRTQQKNNYGYIGMNSNQ